jgi:gamma-glutamyltranspeptidase/glutathione hydrolase
MNSRNIILLFFCFSISIFSQQKEGTFESAAVVSARKEASEIGVAILQKGGNAFDAMVATELALAVCYPYAGNIGGGGFMVYRLNNGEIGALDYREKAPAKATEKMYLDANGKIVPNLSTEGAMSVGIPGTIAGIFAAHEKFGKLSMQEIMQPVIDLAKKGVRVTEKEFAQIESHKKTILEVSGKSNYLSANYQVGDTIKYPKLASTLLRILKNGKNEFYEGETAQKLVSFIQKNGGIISLSDLKNYQPVWRKPIRTQFKNYSIISMSPPSSGGITLSQMLKMAEKYPLKRYKHNSVKYIQILTEVERRAFADRNYYLGDPDFVEIPIQKLLDSVYLENRMSNFNFKKASKSSEIGFGKLPAESMETTHYSIVDSFGNAVSVTTTLNGAFGSKLYSDELGFFFNNQMDDFSSKVGEANSYGLVGSDANKIEPNKRMLSSMTPTIVEKNNKLFMVLGTPGGSTIITSVFQTILNIVVFDYTMQQAVNAFRFHHQHLPDEIRMENNGFSEKIRNRLQKLGYTINLDSNPIIGKVDAIKILENKKIETGADFRGDDKAVGY